MIDPATLQMVLGVLTGWLDRREREVIAYLVEENRLLRRQLGTRRLRPIATSLVIPFEMIVVDKLRDGVAKSSGQECR